MREFVLAYPGQLTTKTGGYYYLSRILEELPKVGWSGSPLSLGSGFPTPSSEVLANATNLVRSTPRGTPILADCLAWGIMQECAQQLASTHKIIPLVHHPLCLESGLSPAESKILFNNEQSVLAFSQNIITTSPATSKCLQELFHIPKSKITVAIPGIDPVEPSRSRDNGIIRLISVGSLTPRKGHDRLIETLSLLKHLPWHLDIVGELTLDPYYAYSVFKQVSEFGLTNRITLHGALERSSLQTLYIQSDIFVLATLYEGYGMAFAEAMIRGIPIVTTGDGAVSSTVPKQAGIVVESNDLSEFLSAISTLITCPKLREKYRKGAIKAGQNLPSWKDTAEKISAVLDSI